MARYVAFLRGMNLGGRRITNERAADRLRRPRADRRRHLPRQRQRRLRRARRASRARTSRRRVEAGLAETLGYEVPVFLRSCEQVAAIAAREPFTADAARGLGRQAPGRDAPGRRRASWRARRRSPWPATRTAWRSRARSSTGCRAAAISESDARPEDARVRARPVDDADDGHDRADRRQALRLASEVGAGSAATSMSRLTAPISSGSSRELDVGDELHLPARAGGRSCRSGWGRRCAG